MVFSCLDSFDTISNQKPKNLENLKFRLEKKKEAYGGYLGCHCYKHDVYFVYGNCFGASQKVIAVTKNFQVLDRKEALKVTSTIHELLLEDQLNPFAKNEVYSDSFVTKVMVFTDKISV